MAEEIVQGRRKVDLEARPELLQQLQRFPKLHRERLRELAQLDRVFAELMLSYPAFAFALATGFGAREDRVAVAQLLVEGHKMLELADLMGLPRWLRKLPPEAFALRLPAFSGEADVNRRLGNLAPASVEQAPRWMRWVGLGMELGGDAFALWLAQQKVYASDEPFWSDSYQSRQTVEPLALYAWFSMRMDGEVVRFIERPWNPRMSFERAVREARGWVDRIKLACAESDERSKPQPWFPEWKRGANRIVPLMSQSALDEEGEAMDHCVATYGNKLRAGQCCIYSVRKGNKRLATVELERRYDAPDRACIAQVQAFGNSPASRSALRQVEKWFARNEDEPLPEAPESVSGRKRWQRMWRHYYETRKGFVSPLLSDRWSKLNVFDPAFDRLAKLAD